MYKYTSREVVVMVYHHAIVAVQDKRYSSAPAHLLTGAELSSLEIEKLLQATHRLKKERMHQQYNPVLLGHHLALLFDKASLRTRFSFTAAMHELGGDVIESVETTRKKETPEDQARVLNGYCHAVMVRTHEDEILQRMSQVSTIPIINGLSNLHHPCQILADLFTLFEVFGSLQDLTLSYIGDGNNILHSLLLLAPQMGVNIHFCCPAERGPDATLLAESFARLNSKSGKIKIFATPQQAVKDAHAVYTDVWTSMGFEQQAAEHLFTGFQVNEELMKLANEKAILMHCLPMERGKEVSHTLPDSACSVIFQQSENRLHIQKALLLYLLKGNL